MRATGTGVALAGSGLLVTGVLLAWPDPLWFTLVASAVGLLFTRIAWRDGLPWFQVGALPALGLACVLGIHGAAGHWAIPEGASAGGWLFHLLGSSTSGIVLVGSALVLAAIAELAVRLGNRPQGIAYALGSVAAGLLGLLAANAHGPNARRSTTTASAENRAGRASHSANGNCQLYVTLMPITSYFPAARRGRSTSS